MKSDFDCVGDFHRKFGLDAFPGGRPKEIDDSAALFRLKFLLEELKEIAEGYGYELRGHHLGGIDFYPIRQSAGAARRDLAKVADGLVDLCYVALGTAHLHLLPWSDLFAEVQRANMSKERAASAGDPRSTRAHALDVVKPEGFVPPRIADALMLAGWPGPALPWEEK